MNFNLHMSASVLVTTIVVCTLMLLCLAAFMSMWELDTVVVAGSKYKHRQRANIESMFNIYKSYPDETGSTYQLYESDERSTMTIERRLWGLYEAVSVASSDGKAYQTRMFGALKASSVDCALYYSDENHSVTLMGSTNLNGQLYLPKQGVVYGQMGAHFFSGEPLVSSNVKSSDSSLPKLNSQATGNVEYLFSITDGDQIEYDVDVNFNNAKTKVICVDSQALSYVSLVGNIIVVGQNITVDSSSVLQNMIVVSDKIRIESNFKGSAQFFAKDSLIVGTNVTLSYPSGLFSKKHIRIGDKSEVNGYVIVHSELPADIEKPNYTQSRLSKVRGLLYVSWAAQLQGIVNGAAYIGQAVYHSSTGYYRHSICDASIIINEHIAYPLWFADIAKREQVLWLR